MNSTSDAWCQSFLTQSSDDNHHDDKDDDDNHHDRKDDEDNHNDAARSLSSRREDPMIQLKYRFKNELEEHFLEVENARMKCPICQTWVKNVHLHLNRKPNCKTLIDMEHFDPIYKDYQK